MELENSIKLIRLQNILYINPWNNQLSDTLTVFRKKTAPGRRGQKLEVTYVPEQLYYISEHASPKVGVTYGGFYNKVTEKLKELNIKYEVVDNQQKLPSIDLSPIEGLELRAGQDKVIASILSSQRGIVRAPPAIGKSFVIELLCLLHPKQKILVVTGSSQVLSDLFRRISKRCKSQKIIQVSAGKSFDETADIIICSSKSLHHIDSEWPDILLFDEVHGSAAPKVGLALASFTKPRMFGFSASPSGRSDSADLMIEAFFGPIICDIKYAEAQSNMVISPIEVWVIPVKGAEVEKSSPTSRDRWNVWRNRTRNDKIKEAVEKFGEDTQILILVNTVEHAFFLRKLLPGFTAVYATLNEDQRYKFGALGICAKDESLQLDRDLMKSMFREGSLKRVIATKTWQEGVDFPDLKVVIRADGTKGPIPATQIGGRLSRISADKTKGVVIDFWDDFGNCFLNRSKNRIRNYQKEGWTIVNGYGDCNL